MEKLGQVFIVAFLSALNFVPDVHWQKLNITDVF